jgi:hypothetical protein
MTSPGLRELSMEDAIHVVLTELLFNPTTPPKPQYH